MKKREPNPFITPLMIFITGFLPAFCLGIPGLFGLILICIYFYEKEAPQQDVFQKLNRTAAIKEVDEKDFNRELLSKYFDLETGLLKDQGKPFDEGIWDWVHYRRESFPLKSYAQNIFQPESDGLYHPEPYFYNTNLRDKKKLTEAYIIHLKNKQMERYTEKELQILKLFNEPEDAPEFLLKEYITHKPTTAYDRRSYCELNLRIIRKNLVGLFYWGVFDGENVNSIDTVAQKNLMDQSENSCTIYRDNLMNLKFSEEEYERFLKSWEEKTLPPIYSAEIDGAARAYLDFLTGHLKEKDNGELVLLGYSWQDNLFCTSRGDSLQKQRKYQAFNLLPKYKILRNI